ncbi:MAG TPA: hypothetical protein VGM12_04760 [Trebonia sp.]|jgi:hypothetical protein
MTPRVLTPDDVVAAAVTVEAALRPVAGRDWSVQAGPLEWDVEQTITHMLGATAKYTLYLASRCQHFIGLTVRRWPDATNDEVIDSVVPVATGLAAVAAVTPPADLYQRVLAQQYPDTAGAGDSWPGLLAATGRPPRHRR